MPGSIRPSMSPRGRTSSSVSRWSAPTTTSPPGQRPPSPRTTRAPNGVRAHTRILPYLEQSNLYAAVNYDVGFNAQPEVCRMKVAVYRCPSEPRDETRPDAGVEFYLTNYGVNIGTWLAYDQQTGRELWRTGVSGVPNASPISYAVDGKQYVAIVTGHGNPLSSGIPDVIPETQLPPVASSTLFVFALPD